MIPKSLCESVHNDYAATYVYRHGLHSSYCIKSRCRCIRQYNHLLWSQKWCSGGTALRCQWCCKSSHDWLAEWKHNIAKWANYLQIALPSYLGPVHRLQNIQPELRPNLHQIPPGGRPAPTLQYPGIIHLEWNSRNDGVSVGKCGQQD